MFLGIAPDCATCWKRDNCASRDDGTFCMGWQSNPPVPAGEDPNERWRRGDDDWDDVHG